MRRTTEHPAREGYAASTRRTDHTERTRHADDPVALLRLILRGVRQRTFVILNPCAISGIDPAVARLATEKMFGLGDATPVDALAEHRPAWSRFTE